MVFVKVFLPSVLFAYGLLAQPTDLSDLKDVHNGRISHSEGSSDRENRIVHGEDAVNAPWMAAMTLTNGTSICGATIIGKKFVLTAAHCCHPIVELKIEIEITVGTNNLDKGGKKLKVKKYHTHPDYNTTTYTNDICMVELTEPIVLGAGVALAGLPTSETPIGTAVMAYGHGKDENGMPTTKLKQAKLTVTSKSKCEKAFGKKRITDSMMCLEGTPSKNGKPTGTCSGDSGGPYIANGNILVALTSFGTANCLRGKPEVGTNIHRFLKYVDEFLKK